MSEPPRSLGITDVVLHDAQQSLLAARLRLDDMLPIAEKLDRVGFWSLETCGGAAFDACIRHLNEDPWARIRALKETMPNTRQQMLLRAQNLLGYRHYADDVVEAFVKRACANGIDVFRICDAMNDPRNLKRSLEAVIENGAHAQGAIVYTLSPAHTIEGWVGLAKRIEAMGAHSLAINDVAGLLTPYTAFDLVSRLKSALSIPIHLRCHATTGLSTATLIKAVEAGIDNIDTAISSMSMTYSHSATESLVAILQGSGRDSELDLALLEDIAGYFREVRSKYAAFEGSLKGIDSRMLRAQVPGGMLANLEAQLEAQGATDRLGEVLTEITSIREELGFIALDTPSSQIVAAQALMNVMFVAKGDARYTSISAQMKALLSGEYGNPPAAFDQQLQQRALQGNRPVTCRPADTIEPQMQRLRDELRAEADRDGIRLQEGECETDDVLLYALF
ncbi:MAG TPA: pyruvate carboxylase subunit B, partial [Modicisalibacter sp.]|nr:pyruvate carboxylase subunit B [Modicisalibacter sp.]